MHDLTDKYVGKRLTLGDKEINPNLAFLINEMPYYRFLVMQGSTRSGKTYSALEYIWDNIEAFSGVKYTITRQSSPVLKGTVIPDFQEIGYNREIYNLKDHNLTDNVYRRNDNEVDFVGAEDEEKIRGRKRNFLYMNEAPELEWPVVQQLLFRTSDKIILDYNPSYTDSWVYDNILTRDDCAFIKTTYKDNPFLTAGQISEIEWMRLNDPEGYKVFGLGERGEVQGQIYANWRKIRPEIYPEDAKVYVIDFGFSQDPACITQLKINDRTVWARTRIYDIGLGNVELMIYLYFMDITESCTLIADSASPKDISELRNGLELTLDDLEQRVMDLNTRFEQRAQRQGTRVMDLQFDYRHTLEGLQAKLKEGFWVNAAMKGPDSISNGIKKVKQYEVLIPEDDAPAWNECSKYKYKVDRSTGKTTRVPIDAFNHFCDTLRYGCFAHGRLF